MAIKRKTNTAAAPRGGNDNSAPAELDEVERQRVRTTMFTLDTLNQLELFNWDSNSISSGRRGLIDLAKWLRLPRLAVYFTLYADNFDNAAVTPDLAAFEAWPGRETALEWIAENEED